VPAISGRASIVVRPYSDLDAADTLSIFVAAVTETASADYTAEQTGAWADPDGRDLRRWGIAMAARRSFAAIIEAQVAGFSDVSRDGYIDMMFVAPRFLGRGVAWQLLAHGEALAREMNAHGLSADVSITAKAFFERQGFIVEAEQHPVMRGISLTNFKMRKALR
jgi:putative acetyltransferase